MATDDAANRVTIDPATLVLRHGLAESDRAWQLDQATWVRLVQWAQSNRMLRLLLDTVEAGEIVPPSPDVLAAPREWVAVAAERRSRVRDGMHDVATVLTDAGIDHRVYKGAATATLFYDGEVRDYADADLVVPAADFNAALDLLHDEGWQSPEGVFRPELAERVHKGQNLRKDQGYVDLHRAVARAPHHLRIGDGPFRAPPATSDPVRLLDEPSLVVTAALDLVLGDRVVKPWAVRDAMQGMRSVDPSRVFAVASDWGVEEYVAIGLDTAAHLLDVPDLLPAWAATMPISAETEWFTTRFREGSSARFHLSVARRLPTWSERLTYLRTYLPTLAQLRRHRGRDLVRREIGGPTTQPAVPDQGDTEQ